MSKPDVSRQFDLAGMKVLVVEDEPEERELLPCRAPTVWRQRGTLNLSIPADGNAKQFQPKPVSKPVQSSAALSMANTIKEGIKTRKIVILASDGFDATTLSFMKKALEGAGAQAKVVAP